MELANEFRVGVPVNEAWSVLTDVERIAPHLPGAQLQEIDGDEYRGVVKVKVGPITAQYKGTAVFQEKDEAAGRVVLRCTGRDTRGQGNANATITAQLQPDGGGTQVTVTTDLTITGKVAQFGRGVLADVSSKLIGQFVDALEADLRDNGAAGRPAAAVADPAGSGPSSAGNVLPGDAASADSAPSESSANGSKPAEPVPVASGVRSQAAGGAGAAGSPGTGNMPAAETPASGSSGPRKVDQPEPAPVDLLEAAGGSVAKRLVPLAGALGALLAALAWWRRSRRSA